MASTTHTSSLPASRPAPSVPKPWVLVPACDRLLGDHRFHIAGEKYLGAVRLAGAMPLIMPAGERDPEELQRLLELADGVLLPGSPSNVHPRHFEQDVLDASLPLDPHRDALTLSLIPEVMRRGIPLFAICRGFQEVNVALGGSLHQAVHQVSGLRDHRERLGTLDEQYGPAHHVTVAPGGLLERCLSQPSFQVNSLHGQGIDMLAPGLRVEALSEEGLVEAFSWPQSRGFNLSVQWHPEWQAAKNPVSTCLFAAFGEACLRYRQAKDSSPQDPPE
ncbi:MAG: gamma-glutamyl-gamma-aminobutyrate hydrolase family protein [Pseudomonadota bacterium]